MEFIDFLKHNAFQFLDTSGHSVDLQGWVNGGFQESLQKITEELKNKNQVIFFEVGSWKGASVSKICNHLKNEKVDIRSVICIDTWLGAPEFLTWGLNDPTRGLSLANRNGYPTIFYTFTKNMKCLGHDDIISPFPMSSVQAAEVLRHYGIMADVIYIDGSHEYKAVMSDLEEFKTLLKPGGILWGDDYGGAWLGVTKAVDECSLKYNFKKEIIGYNWLLRHIN
jgi:hypothetical protein